MLTVLLLLVLGALFGLTYNAIAHLDSHLIDLEYRMEESGVLKPENNYWRGNE